LDILSDRSCMGVKEDELTNWIWFGWCWRISTNWHFYSMYARLWIIPVMKAEFKTELYFFVMKAEFRPEL
jgi:hypothetical protein